MSNLKKRHIFLPIILGVLTPSLVIFIVEVFVGHISPMNSIRGIIERQFAEGHNLFSIMVFGLIPFAILIGITGMLARTRKSVTLECLFLGGLLGILIFMVFGHVTVWYPLYGGGHMSSTAVIAFFFIPFYCIGTMGVGMLIGWLVSRLPFIESKGG